jgi:hypothetical protein
MRILVLTVAAGCVFACTASGAGRPVVAVARTSLRIPTGWHAVVSRTPACDPERLIVASSAPLRITASGTVRSPARGEVTILLLEDIKFRPANPVSRPARFSVRWDELQNITSICGNPKTPAFMTWFRDHRRYIGFIVYPHGNVPSATRTSALAVMDSLRVAR